MESTTLSAAVFSDEPVSQPGSDDWLNREPFAENMGRLLAAAGRDRSVVFALFGRYGEGKTTVLNFVEHILNRDAKPRRGSASGLPVLIRFEPWVFSNSENLIRAFFSEVASQLSGKFPENPEMATKAANRLSTLGNTLEWAGKSVQAIEPLAMLLGFPGMAALLGQGLSTSASVAKAGSDVVKPLSSPSVAEEKKEFEKALKNLPSPIVVVLDDFDRLTPDEALLMMQLVKATTNVKGLHYLIVADRSNLEKHLQSKSISTDYLEKIVQYDLTLPSVDPLLLKAKLKEAFHDILKVTKNAGDNWLERWEMLHLGPGQLFFPTVRSVKRFLASFEFYVTAFREDGYVEVDLVELWGVELLRVFAPEAHRALYESKERIFRDSISEIFDAPETSMEQIVNPIVEQASERFKPIVRDLLDWLIGTERSEIVLREQHQWLNMSVRTSEFFAAYFRIEVPEFQIRQRVLGQWAEAAKCDSVEVLKRLIVPICNDCGLDSVVRAVQSRWIGFTSAQKVALVHAICGIQVGNSSARGQYQGRGNLIAKWLSEMPVGKERKTRLESLLKNEACHSAILSFLLEDQRTAWEKNLPLVSRSMRSVFFKCIAVTSQEAGEKGDDLAGFKREELLRVWSLYGNKGVTKQWVMRQCDESKSAFQFIHQIGSLHTTSSYWNRKSREVTLHISAVEAALLPVKHKELKRVLERHASTSNDGEERMKFEDAAWCMERAEEDAAARREVLRKVPELVCPYVWVPDKIKYQTANVLRLIVPSDDTGLWMAKVPVGVGGVTNVVLCAYSRTVNGKRKSAVLIELSEAPGEPKGRAERLHRLGIEGGWVWMNRVFGIIDPKTGELCWTGFASDHVFYLGPEKLFNVSQDGIAPPLEE